MDREVKLVVLVRGHSEGLLHVTLGLQKLGHAVVVVLRDGLQDTLCGLQVPPHHHSLVLDNGQQKFVGDDGEVLVHQNEPVQVPQVAHEVHRVVQVEERRNLPAHNIVQVPRSVRVDQALPDPDRGLGLGGDLVDDLEGVLHAVLGDLLAALQVLIHDGPVKGQDVKGVLSDNGKGLTTVRPCHVLHSHVDPPDHRAVQPVVEADEVTSPHPKEGPTVNSLGVVIKPNGLVFLEVLEDLEARGRLLDSVHRRVIAPHKVQALAKALVSPCQRRVNDVLPVAADRDEPAIRRVLEGLRVHVRGPEVLDRQGNPLPVVKLRVRGQGLEVHGLDLVVLGHDDLATGIHGCEGLLPADLDQNGSLVVTDGQQVRALEVGDGPHPLQAVVQGLLQPVGGGVPEPDGAVLRPCDDEGELGVEAHRRYVVRVPLEGVHAALGLVVPDLHPLVVSSRDQMGLVPARKVLKAVDALVVALQGKVGDLLARRPDLDRVVERGTGEGVGVLGVEDHLHDVVGVPLKHLGAGPALLPVPQLDEHVIAAREQEGLRGVHGHGPDVVRVRLEDLDLWSRDGG